MVGGKLDGSFWDTESGDAAERTIALFLLSDDFEIVQTVECDREDLVQVR